jgi:PilZ domain
VTRSPRPTPRQQLILQVEFDSAASFRASYLSNLSGGGLRVDTSLPVGLALSLHISFRGLVDLFEIKAAVQWSLPGPHPEGPAAGLAFVDPSPAARAWLDEVLGGSARTGIAPEPSYRVLLLEAQPFLREIYGQEVRNWVELRDEAALALVALGDVAAWFEEVGRGPAALGIIDVDELPIPALDLYRRVRADVRSATLPLILIGSPAGVAPLSLVSDERLRCLHKPLKFGLLMTTVGGLVRDPLPASVPVRSSGRGRA